MQRSLQKLGNEADVWGLGHLNFALTPDWESYDAIINLENYDTAGWVPSLHHTRRPKKLLWSIDAHCRGMQPYLDTYHNGKYDVILQSTEDFVDTRERSIWFPNCYDDSLLKPLNVRKTVDIGFCGSLLNRRGILAHLEKKYGLNKHIFVIGEEMVRLVNSFWIHFNVNLANDINYRSFETIGCGTVLLTNYNPQYEKLGFVDDHNFLMYRDLGELEDKIETYLGRSDKLVPIIENGKVLARRHTYDVRAKYLLEIINNLLDDDVPALDLKITTPRLIRR